MKLNEMNFSDYPSKLPSFMMKSANAAIDAYLMYDEELMETDPDKLIKKYKLTTYEDSDSWAYLDNIQHDILKMFGDDNDELIEKLCTDGKLFMQAIKSVPANILLSNLWYHVGSKKGMPDFKDFTVYDIAVALNCVVLSVCMNNREKELEDHCDMINDYMDQTIEVKNNPRYESIRRNRRRNTYR